MGSAARSDDDVHLRQRGQELLILDNRALEQAGHLSRALVGAVGDEDVGHAGAVQVLRREFGHLPRPNDHDALAGQRAEDLARQFDRRVTDRNRVFPDAGLGAHALGDAEGARQDGIEKAADRAVGFGCRVGALDLAQDLRLADHHGIETRRNPKQVMNRLLVGQVVKMRGDLTERDAPALAQKAVHRGLVPVLRGDGDLDAVAGGENHALGDAVAAHQAAQGRRERVGIERQLLPHFHGRRFVIDPGDQESHRLKRLFSPVCAAQVMAEQPTSPSTMKAALRPLQPAVTRKNTITRYSAQVASEMMMRGSRIQRVPDSMEAQVEPAITASVMKTKPIERARDIMVSSVPSGGKVPPDFLVFSCR